MAYVVTKFMCLLSLLGLGMASPDDANCTDDSILIQRLRKAPCESGNEINFSKAPVTWNAAGGGLLATAVSQGFANAFGRARLFESPQLASLACASGSCWFLLRFSYDEEYFKSILDEDDSTLEAFLFQVWQEYSLAGFGDLVELGIKSAASRRARLMIDMAERARQLGLGDHLGDTFWLNTLIGVNFGFDWIVPVSKLFLNATLQVSTARPVLTKPSLHIQVTYGTSMFVDPINASAFSNINEPTEVNWGLSSTEGPIAFQAQPVVAFPMQWRVPSADAKAETAGFRIPSPKEVTFNVESVGANNSYQLVELTPAPFANGVEDFRDKQKFSLPTTIGIGHLAAATSSVGSKPVNPSMFSQILFNATGGDQNKFEDFLSTTFSDGNTLPPHPYREYFDGTRSMGVSNMAACTKLSDDETCPYPHTRFVDGGFSDDMATAQTIADLQQRYVGQPLRVILTDQGKLTKNETLDQEALHDLAVSFFDGKGPAPGEFAVDPIRGFTRPSPATFSLPVAKLEDLDFKNSSLPDVTRPGFSCRTECTKSLPRKLFWTKLSTQTVYNPSFGVQAGTPVELLIFFVEADENLVFSRFLTSGHKCAACLAGELSMSPDIKEQVEEFLQR